MIDMVFAPVDPTIREKVIAAYLAGHGRNQITRDLHGQGIKVSHGSISNIINGYKRKHEQPQSLESSDINPSCRVSDSYHLLTKRGVGQAVTPRNGGPLSHLLSIEGQSTITTSQEDVKNIERGREGQQLTTLVQEQDPFIQDIDFEDNSYDHDFGSDVYTANDDGRPLTPVDQGWDPDESYQTRFWNRIMIERRRRQEELLLIEEQRQELNIERQQITQIRSIIDQQKFGTHTSVFVSH